MGFKKFDGKKNRIELIEPEFIEGLGNVLTFGAEKYEAHNWKLAVTQEDQDRIYGALQRHLLAHRKGERFDPETGMSHLYHAAFGLMTLDYFDRLKEKKTILKCAGEVEYPEPKLETTDEWIIRLLANSPFIYKGVKEGKYCIENLQGKVDKFVYFSNLITLESWVNEQDHPTMDPN